MQPAPSDFIQSEAERSKADANFQWLVSSIAADEKQRARKVAVAESGQAQGRKRSFDAARLQRENERRAALGKPALKNLEELEKAASEEASPDKVPDVLLDRTTEIMGRYRQRGHHRGAEALGHHCRQAAAGQ